MYLMNTNVNTLSN